MLESDYSQRLADVLASTTMDINVPRQWQHILTQRGVVQTLPGDCRRRFVRFFFPSKAVLELSQSLPAIARPHTKYQVLTKDLSRDGICFLHSEQLYPHEQIVLWLPSGKKRFLVARCLRINSRCYEVGARLG